PPKRGKFRGRKKYHTVKNGETMYMISQLYGVKLEKLYKRNRLDPKEGRDPVNGAQIYLKGKSEKAPKLQPRGYEPPSISTPVNDPNNPGSAWRPATTTNPNSNTTSTNNTNSLPNNPNDIVVPPPVNRPVTTDPQTERPQPTDPPTNNSELDELDNILFRPNQGSPENTEPVDPEIPAPAKPNIHTVQPGDTLYSISRKYNLTVDQLKRKNGLTDNLIKVGQELIIE
ncbi:MAG: LysM domain-containing protein, partial [Bacteroidota bacterium]